MKEIESDGSIYYCVEDGSVHGGDHPGMVEDAGVHVWRRMDENHRDDGPAQVNPRGVMSWYDEGEVHRTNAPAIIGPDDRIWYLYGFEFDEEGARAFLDGFTGGSGIRLSHWSTTGVRERP